MSSFKKDALDFQYRNWTPRVKMGDKNIKIMYTGGKVIFFLDF